MSTGQVTYKNVFNNKVGTCTPAEFTKMQRTFKGRFKLIAGPEAPKNPAPAPKEAREAGKAPKDQPGEEASKK